MGLMNFVVNGGGGGGDGAFSVPIKQGTIVLILCCNGQKRRHANFL